LQTLAGGRGRGGGRGAHTTPKEHAKKIGKGKKGVNSNSVGATGQGTLREKKAFY